MNKKILSGSALKWIALVTMLIDHIGAVLIPVLYSKGIGSMHFDWQFIYTVSRWIGRMSFPIFCFLLIEGYIHTSNKGKYFLRMVFFALISEVFFDYAVYGKLWYTGKQNIFFALALGIILMQGTDLIFSMIKMQVLQGICAVIWWYGGMLFADLLELDYGMYGIFSIGILYLLRNLREIQVLGGALSFCWELPAPLGFVPVYFYNGKRGKQNKYFFYLFYPVHLSLLGLIKFLISNQ